MFSKQAQLVIHIIKSFQIEFYEENRTHLGSLWNHDVVTNQGKQVQLFISCVFYYTCHLLKQRPRAAGCFLILRKSWKLWTSTSIATDSRHFMTTLKNSIFFTQDTYFIVMMMQSEALHNRVKLFWNRIWSLNYLQFNKILEKLVLDWLKCWNNYKSKMSAT